MNQKQKQRNIHLVKKNVKLKQKVSNSTKRSDTYKEEKTLDLNHGIAKKEILDLSKKM